MLLSDLFIEFVHYPVSFFRIAFAICAPAFVDIRLSLSGREILLMPFIEVFTVCRHIGRFFYDVISGLPIKVLYFEPFISPVLMKNVAGKLSPFIIGRALRNWFMVPSS